MNLFSPQLEISESDGQSASQSPCTHAHQGGVQGDGCGIPPLVIRGESLNPEGFPESGERYQFVTDGNRGQVISHPLPKPDVLAYAAITDYLNFTFPFHSKNLAQLFIDLFVCLGERFSPATDLQRPLHYYPNSFSLGKTSAKFAYGDQGGIISLPGEACTLVPDWYALIALGRDRLKGSISRWDGAVDSYNGDFSVDLAYQYYHEKKFNAGGRNPHIEKRGNWDEPDGKGRTLYIGKRENGKMLRVYEKGMQLGCPNHPWVRWEVEYHNASRIIPWEVLLEPGKYLVGAYPKALCWVQEEMQRIRTIQKTGEISYDVLIHHAANGYGKLINVMLKVEGSAEKVIEKLIREGIPTRLDTPSLKSVGE